MQPDTNDNTHETLAHIRSIMDRSARFISLSGWAGIWAGCTALAGGSVAFSWMQDPAYRQLKVNEAEQGIYSFNEVVMRFITLAIIVIIVALIGGLYFTYRKASRTGQTLWNNASRQMLLSLFFPLFAGGMFSLAFIYNGCSMFVAPACLAFYGLALISASRHTLSVIRYLGTLDVMLGCANLWLPGYGLYFWIFGFGILHILYGAIMWNRYEKQPRQ